MLTKNVSVVTAAPDRSSLALGQLVCLSHVPAAKVVLTPHRVCGDPGQKQAVVSPGLW